MGAIRAMASNFSSIESGLPAAPHKGWEATSLAQDKGSGIGGAASIKGSLSALQAKVAARDKASYRNQPKKAQPKPKPPRSDDDSPPFCGLLPCHAWCAWLLVLGILLGLGLGLALGSNINDSSAASRAYLFIPFWLAGAIAVPCYYRLARHYSDDDDMGCGFGDYDEGPGNIGCAMTTSILCWCVLLGAGGSIAAIVVTPAVVNATGT